MGSDKAPDLQTQLLDDREKLFARVNALERERDRLRRHLNLMHSIIKSHEARAEKFRAQVDKLVEALDGTVVALDDLALSGDIADCGAVEAGEATTLARVALASVREGKETI